MTKDTLVVWSWESWLHIRSTLWVYPFSNWRQPHWQPAFLPTNEFSRNTQSWQSDCWHFCTTFYFWNERYFYSEIYGAFRRYIKLLYRCKVFINPPVVVRPGGVNHNAFIVVVHPGGLIVTINALWLAPPLLWLTHPCICDGYYWDCDIE